MGKIVGGFATSHVLFAPTGVEEQAQRVFAGMLEIRSRILALAPDIIIVASSDHLNNFTLKHQVTLAVGVADGFVPLGDMGIPQTPFAGHRDFAETLVREASGHGFDLVQAEELRPDHGLMLTKLIADPEGAIPIVPVCINSAMPVPPSLDRCHALGRTLREIVEAVRPPNERIVVIGSGGLSHWLRVPGQGRVSADFDRHVLRELTEGRAREIARMGNEELAKQSGNGGLELASWLFMVGALPNGARGETVFYEPISEWGSGMGGVAFHA